MSIFCEVRDRRENLNHFFSQISLDGWELPEERLLDGVAAQGSFNLGPVEIKPNPRVHTAVQISKEKNISGEGRI